MAASRCRRRCCSAWRRSAWTVSISTASVRRCGAKDPGRSSTSAASARPSPAVPARSNATSSRSACSDFPERERRASTSITVASSHLGSVALSTMDFTPRAVDEEDARRYVAEGFWRDDSLGALLGAGLHDAASHPFTVRSDRMPYRGTLGEVDALARRVAAGLRRRGIGPGDAVAFQLPNWREAAATFYAITYLGAVVVPIVHFYGSKEVGYILRKTRVKALVTADRFGHQDFLANLDGLLPDLPDLEWVAVVGDREGRGHLAFDDLMHDGSIDEVADVDP